MLAKSREDVAEGQIQPWIVRPVFLGRAKMRKGLRQRSFQEDTIVVLAVKDEEQSHAAMIRLGEFVSLLVCDLHQPRVARHELIAISGRVFLPILQQALNVNAGISCLTEFQILFGEQRTNRYVIGKLLNVC